MIRLRARLRLNPMKKPAIVKIHLDAASALPPKVTAFSPKRRAAAKAHLASFMVNQSVGIGAKLGCSNEMPGLPRQRIHDPARQLPSPREFL